MDIWAYLHQFLFGFYPYIALTVFFVGSLLRFDREQYSWRADSSQLLRKKQLRWGSNLFHFGVLVVFTGHLVGFLMPEPIVLAFMNEHAHELLAMVGGGVAGVAAIIGLSILIHRRLTEPRLRSNSRPWDLLIVAILWIQLALGLATVYFSSVKVEGYSFQALIYYVQGIVIFRPNNADLLLTIPWVYKLHIFLGLTIFLVFPFTRLVHIWSGFASVFYLFRPFQLMRTRRTRQARGVQGIK
ncbi:respiratory nitrate reductase subunit gamma [Jeongeupia naejangsanensis]|uniref:Respiratory nitrate reductase subunit gamma n=1 Tax=Jeongeupia naejangsanensis TaxID=613195 RepID=A0ABS2BPX0_9NEIS|nr:respiratory nitrate reductase subunit gamma [Jeongeupia naejangsanensis]MBM3116839.1 respiratory nitrate reductase subunit gamma [Jeongeupia naejangsanensis]